VWNAPTPQEVLAFMIEEEPTETELEAQAI
jgi:hypothetical protein